MSDLKSGGDRGRPLVVLHIGDLHVTELPERSHSALKVREDRLDADLGAILGDVGEIQPSNCIDFVYLPGDLAENGCRAEYDRIAAALDRISHIPVRLIPGDHDRALGDMDGFAAFRGGLKGQHRHPKPVTAHVDRPLQGCPPEQPTAPIDQFYFGATFAEVRCVFLDMVSAGYGRKGVGLDFRLGTPQYEWLAGELTRSQRPCAVFAHAYPGDMLDKEATADLAGLFWTTGVRIVEMGHTHYNELGHDGRTVYAAARSVGQNEDGPPGYAVVAIDGDATSWRFKQVQQTWPFVIITSPADRRLAHAPLVPVGGRVTVRAVVLTDALADCVCSCRADDGHWSPMKPKGDGLFEGSVSWTEGSRSIAVSATDTRRYVRWSKDYLDVDTVEPATINLPPRMRPDGLGSDAFAIRPWPRKGVRADQLGPNKVGRKW